MAFLELAALAKTYPDGTRAVKGIDFAAAQGEFVVLLGPSGCGKTTTLRMVAGLELPSAGTIRLAGADVTALPPSARDVGFVFQFYALYPHLSVAENIAFPLACGGMAKGERAAAVATIARRLGLTGLLQKKPRELSGGDQQRVGLARAIVRRPAIWLMDEPLGTLDADRRLAMCEFLREQQLAARVTTLYVTHDQEEAMRLADRIVVMKDGMIEQVGTPLEVYDEPATLFVAHFVGSPGMNFLEGERVGAGAVTLGVRPEYVRVAAAGSRGALNARVQQVQDIGTYWLLTARLGEATVRARLAADAPVPAVGGDVWLQVLGERTCFYKNEELVQ